MFSYVHSPPLRCPTENERGCCTFHLPDCSYLPGIHAGHHHHHQKDPPVGLGGGRAGVLWWVIRWRWEGGNELIEIQGLVEHGAMGGHAGWAGGMYPLWKELENREIQSYLGHLVWLMSN